MNQCGARDFCDDNVIEVEDIVNQIRCKGECNVTKESELLAEVPKETNSPEMEGEKIKSKFCQLQNFTVFFMVLRYTFSCNFLQFFFTKYEIYHKTKFYPL